MAEIWDMVEIQEKLKQISGLFSVTEMICAWCYNENGVLLASSGGREVFDAAFDLLSCKTHMLEHYREQHSPYVAALPFGLVWLTAASSTTQGRKRIFAVGPVFLAQISYEQIQKELFRAVTKTPGIVSAHELDSQISALPVFPGNMLSHYALMLHFLLTGEHLQISDISINNKLDPAGARKWLQDKDRHKRWLAEQTLMQAVRDGNLNYHQAFTNAQALSQGIGISSSSDPLRSGKTSAAIFISLCTRAAIEGGLSPDEAYSLGDYYIQNAENCRDYSEIMCCNHDMYADFIQRVHKHKMSPDYSPQIRACCDYIDFHIEEKLSIKVLAKRIGYSEYYLSKRFRQETGITINHYIRHAKIERAKLFLATSDLSIDTIAERLHFSSRGYFGEIFQKVTLTTPAAYRREHRSV